MNGDDIEVQRGDKYVPLNDRLDAIDKELVGLRRILYVLGLIMLIHLLLPNFDLLAYLLSALGM